MEKFLKESGVNNNSVESASIIGGNINQMCHPNDNTIINYNTSNGEVHATNRRDILDFLRSNQWAGENKANRDVIFYVDPKYCTQTDAALIDGVTMPQDIISGEEAKLYNDNVRQEIASLNLNCTYQESSSFKPKYEDFFGPQNVERLKKATVNFGITPEEMKCPLHANVEVSPEMKMRLINPQEVSYTVPMDTNRNLSSGGSGRAIKPYENIYNNNAPQNNEIKLNQIGEATEIVLQQIINKAPVAEEKNCCHIM